MYYIWKYYYVVIQLVITEGIYFCECVPCELFELLSFSNVYYYICVSYKVLFSSRKAHEAHSIFVD